MCVFGASGLSQARHPAGDEGAVDSDVYVLAPPSGIRCVGACLRVSVWEDVILQ